MEPAHRQDIRAQEFYVTLYSCRIQSDNIFNFHVREESGKKSPLSMAGAAHPAWNAPPPHPHSSGEGATATHSRKVRWPRRDCPNHRNNQKDRCTWSPCP